MESTIVRSLYNDIYSSPNRLSPTIFSEKGYSQLYAPSSMYRNSIYIRNSYYKEGPKFQTSVVICATGERESLIETLDSLCEQTYKSFEVILVTKKGNLAECRQEGLEVSSGNIVVFIDDDVICTSRWMESIIRVFKENPKAVGASGPTIIPKDFKKNRDLFRSNIKTKIYEHLFLGSNRFIPGSLSKCGTPSLASNYEPCDYQGEVDYLEACNMSVKKEEAINVGGFDPKYIKTSEWCEVDLAQKLKSKGSLVFSKDIKLYHRPSVSGVYKSRLRTRHRWDNFMRFQRRWVRPSLGSRIYQSFMWTYFKLKEFKLC